MGTFTELNLKVKVDEYAERVIMSTCQNKGGAFDRVLLSDSACFDTVGVETHQMFYNPGELILTVSTSLKNYDDEIDEFLIWLAPHVIDSEGFVGYTRSEDMRWDVTPIFFTCGKFHTDKDNPNTEEPIR